MEKSYERPKLSRPWRQRIRAFFRFVFGLLVLAVVAGVLAWLFSRESALSFYGIVDAGAENVGPVESARIVSVDVVPGQKVKAGDVLVRFDSAERLLTEALDEVKLREYEQSMVRAKEGMLEARRRCRQLAREAAVALEERRLECRRDEAELAGLDAEIARISPMVEKKLVSELELTALRPKADALRRALSGYAPLICALSNRLVQAEADLAEIERQIASRGTGEETSLRDAMKRCEELRQADHSTLKAVTAGTVSQVFRRAGDIVPAGEPVVRIAAAPDARYVVGMLPSESIDALHVGDELDVIRAVAVRRGDLAAAPVRGRVETIASEVLDFFDPMNTAPRTPVRGRKVRIRLTGDASAFIPGESVQIVKGNPAR